jgi:putative hydrolase of the HAD superfamily
MSVEVVLLDAAGTLLTERRTRDEIYAEVLEQFGCPQTLPELARLRAEIHDELPELWQGHPRYSDRWFRELVRRLLQRIGCEAEPEAVRAAIAQQFARPESFVVYGDVPPALDELLQAGLRLAVVSNWNAHLPRLLEQLGLGDCFEVVLASAAFGRSKPDPAIFLEALRLLGVRPSEALHVGDNPVNDVAAARRAGLSALLLDRSPGRRPGPEVLRSLEELPGRLSRERLSGG